jgi:hypothetical protein
MSGSQKKFLTSALPMTTSRKINILQGCEHKEKQTHSEILGCECGLLQRPNTVSSDFGIAPEQGRFSTPEERSSHLPKSRKDRHKYIFDRTCAEPGSATVGCGGSPGQNVRELSGWASHLSGGEGIVERTNAILVFESGAYHAVLTCP